MAEPMDAILTVFLAGVCFWRRLTHGSSHLALRSSGGRMAVDATGRTATPLMLKENVRAVGRTRHRIIHRHMQKTFTIGGDYVN